ncbi:MAG TPA: AsmA family protein, partial [Acetobacteraceae bacterium]|nr:AsmA family protein [Acetobacteraceae bacterium]
MAWRRALRWLLWSGVAAAGLVVAAALSSPLWLRPVAERQASAVLGRPVSIGGLRLRPGDPLVLIAEDVVVGNPQDFPAGEEPFARVPRAVVRLDAWASLRRREVVVTSIELERPALHVVATEDGRANHRVGPSDGPAGGGAVPPIGALAIVDGHARISLAGLRADFEVAFATEQGAAEGGGAPRIAAEAQGTYAGQPVEARFAGGAPHELLRDPSKPWPVELHLTNGPTRASLNG